MESFEKKLEDLNRILTPEFLTTLSVEKLDELLKLFEETKNKLEKGDSNDI